MIEHNGKYYVYRHVRLDNDTVFYVGMGRKSKDDLKYGYYSRANTRCGRNFFWERIIGVTKYRVDIIIESNSKDFIFSKEIEFIKLYGRRDLKLGTLCNLNDGGNGGNLSELSKVKQEKAKKETGSYYRNVERMRKYANLHNSTAVHCFKKTYLYSLDGVFIREFKSRTECKKYLGICSYTLFKGIRERESCSGFFVCTYLVKRLDISLFKVVTQKRHVIKIDKITYEILQSYESTVEASKNVLGDKGNLGHAINGATTYKGYYWSYTEKYEETVEKLKFKKSLPYPEERRQKARDTFTKYLKDNPTAHIREKPIINIETGEVYSGISKILSIVNKSRKLMQRRLGGEIINDTPFRYTGEKQRSA